jgi:DNA-binding NarL/FixJ family response regulator
MARAMTSCPSGATRGLHLAPHRPTLARMEEEKRKGRPQEVEGREQLLADVVRWHQEYLTAKRERAAAVARARGAGLLLREIGEPLSVSPGTINGIYTYAKAKGLT